MGLPLIYISLVALYLFFELLILDDFKEIFNKTRDLEQLTEQQIDDDDFDNLVNSNSLYLFIIRYNVSLWVFLSISILFFLLQSDFYKALLLVGITLLQIVRISKVSLIVKITLIFLLLESLIFNYYTNYV
jgi:hypothetical protein